MTTLEKLLFWKAAGGGSPLYERTIINNPASFTTEVAKPLKGLSIPFTPVQSGTGDPSPSNIRPITGFTGLNIYRTGKNLFDKTVSPLVGYITSGNTIASFNVTRTVYCPCTPSTTYTVSKKQSSRFAVAYTKELPVIGSNVYGAITNNSATQIAITTGADAMYIVVFCYHANYDTDTYQDIVDTLQVEIGETATAYEPYNGTTVPVSWQTEAGTVYGGTLDALTGVLTVEWIAITKPFSEIKYSEGEEMKQGNIIFPEPIYVAGESGVQTKNICNIAVWLWAGINNTTPHFYTGHSDTYKAYVVVPIDMDESTSVTVAAMLKTPQTVQLDPVTLSTLIGENVIWTDTNSDNTIVYLSKTQGAGLGGGFGGGLGGGFGSGFGSGSDDPGDPSDPDEPIDPDDPEIPEEPIDE